jgi:abortive infection bacteriophage resistance protein
MKIDFNKHKPVLTIEEQIKLLKKRNLVVEDEDLIDLERFLSCKNYYRIAPYWKTMNCKNHIIKGNVNFKQIKKRYNIDHNLIISTLESLKVIEIGLKTKFSHLLSLKYNDPYFYINPNIFINRDEHRETLNNIKKELNRNKSNFIGHYKDNYIEDLPPIWATVEVMSFGSIVKLLSLLRSRKDKELFEKEFNMSFRMLINSMKIFNVLRNLCAHHSILFNQNFKINLYRNNTSQYREIEEIMNKNPKQEKKIYNWVMLILYFLKENNLESSYKGKIINIFKKINKEDYFFYGIPNNFKDLLDNV